MDISWRINCTPSNVLDKCWINVPHAIDCTAAQTFDRNIFPIGSPLISVR